MTTIDVIHGQDLITHAEELNISPKMLARIDPEGANIVRLRFPYEKGRLIRALVLFKLKGNKHPEEGALAIPAVLWEDLVQTITIPDGTPIIQ